MYNFIQDRYSAGCMECILGTRLGMPLVTQIGTLSSHSAQRTQTWHQHRGFELLFVLNGATAWEFQDGSTINVPGGHFLVVPPQTVHRGELAMRRPSKLCGLLCDPTCPGGGRNSSFTAQDLRWLDQRFAGAALSVSTMSRELLSRVNRLIALQRSLDNDPRNPQVLAGLRTTASSAILEAARGLTAAPTTGPTELVNAAKAYLSRHIGDAVGIPDLVRHLGFSRSHLFTIFRSVTGMTPNDYFLRLRIETAQQRLVGSRRPITEIALGLGFSSSQYFSSVFRKYTGQTPMEYRRSAAVGPVISG